MRIDIRLVWRRLGKVTALRERLDPFEPNSLVKAFSHNSVIVVIANE